MRKHFNNKLPENFQNCFIKLQTIHSVNAWRQASGLNYNIPIYKTVRHQRSVKYQGATLWHSILHDIGKVTFRKFKKVCKTYLFTGYYSIETARSKSQLFISRNNYAQSRIPLNNCSCQLRLYGNQLLIYFLHF